MEAPVVIKAFTIERRVGTTNTGEAPFAQPIPPQGTTVHARNRTNHPIRDRFVSEEEVDFLYDDGKLLSAVGQ
jgi:hypothetical protein